ncbi:MAG: S8 family serine peptidase [Betaproteobacteria bacterium]
MSAAPRPRRAAAVCGAAVLALACAAPAFAAPRLIVQFADDDVEAAFAPKSRVERLGLDLGAEAHHLRRMALGAHLVEFPEGTDVHAAAAAAIVQGGAKIAVPDRRLRAAKVPNDTNLQSQPYLRNDPASVSAYSAWDVTTGSPSVVVAVLDTGVLPHPDLAGRLLPGYDFVSDVDTANDSNGRDADPTDPGDWIDLADLGSGKFPDCEVDSSSWHGTSVAGVIGANGNNGLALAGLDWSARILPLRVLGKCGGNFSDIFDAIAWAAGYAVPGVPANQYPAQIVNLSLGGDNDPCTAQDDALLSQFLSPSGLRAIVVAAGNNAGDANQQFPSSCPSAISVAATTNGGNRTSYSNYGSSVDIAAPGGQGGVPGSPDFGLIAVLSNTGTTTAAGYYVRGIAGTSFAAPIVSGVASLMLSVAPNLTPAQVRAIIQDTAKAFPPSSQCTPTSCGHGIVNAQGAVLAAQAAAPGAQQVPVVEYFNAGFGHYFMSADNDEITGLDGGAFGGAFVRSGRQFNAWNLPTTGTEPVCRFFTVTFAPKSSHFYTADPVECAGVKLNPNWQYEKIAFHIRVPVAGECTAGTLPVYRMYNNGQTGAPNHRFTTDLALYQQFTTAQNWAPEGIAFCAPQ